MLWNKICYLSFFPDTVIPKVCKWSNFLYFTPNVFFTSIDEMLHCLYSHRYFLVYSPFYFYILITYLLNFRSKMPKIRRSKKPPPGNHFHIILIQYTYLFSIWNLFLNILLSYFLFFPLLSLSLFVSLSLFIFTSLFVSLFFSLSLTYSL